MNHLKINYQNSNEHQQSVAMMLARSVPTLNTTSISQYIRSVTFNFNVSFLHPLGVDEAGELM